MRTLKARDTLVWAESVTVTVKPKTPAAEGCPLSAPPESSDSPAGSAPLVTAHL